MLEAALAAVFGLLIGSFLNVCIYRWPRDLSVVHPRSRCPHCDALIAWFDNIPLLSFLLLKGKCRSCGGAISRRYPFVELATALLFAWFTYKFGVSIETARGCVFTAMLLTLGVADLETRILPDQFTLGGIAAGLLFAFVEPLPELAGPGEHGWSLLMAVAGAVIPAGALWLGGALFERIRHKEGLGFGDVKMTAMMGAFLGLPGALLALMIGSTLGSLVGVTYLAITKKDAGSYELPLGTFLAIGATVVALAGSSLLAFYARFS